jgi:hypothetical protein
LDPNRFSWHRYHHHQRRQRLMRQLDLVTWVLLVLLAAGLVFVLLVSRPA